MSELSANSSNEVPASRPVSIIVVLAIFATFAAFLGFVYYAYLRNPNEVPGPFNGDGIHTVEQREKNLHDLREKQNAQAAKYAWVDQKAGIVQLPIDRAIELTAQQYGTGAKK
jgi:hypothetical protein